MARVQILSTFVTLFIIAPTLCLQKEQVKKDEVKIVEIHDATFFNSVYIENHDFLVLVIPDECTECQGLMKEFEKNKVKIAKGWMIKSEAERLYNESRKAPYHFDTHKDYLAYDDKLRADTKALAIEMHKEKDD